MAIARIVGSGNCELVSWKTPTDSLTIPNTGEIDLWDGVWGSDGVSMNFFIGSNDEGSQIGNSNWFTMSQFEGADMTAGFYGQSGSPATAISSENQRNNLPMFVTRVVTNEPLDDLLEPTSPAGTHTAYIADINAFSVEVDPAQVNSVTNANLPNADSGWEVQNFGGAIQGFDITLSEDGGANGATANHVIATLAAGLSAADIGNLIFSDGTGSGMASIRIEGGMTSCDFDNSSSCDIADLNLLMYTGLGTADAQFDLDGSGSVDLADRDAFLRHFAIEKAKELRVRVLGVQLCGCTQDEN